MFAKRCANGRLLGHGPDLRGSASVDVDRITLRTLLAEAVGEDLHLGRNVSGAELDGDGLPWVVFADGTSVTADLLIGADGVHSNERGSEVLTQAMRTVRWILATDTTMGAAATALTTPILATAARLCR